MTAKPDVSVLSGEDEFVTSDQHFGHLRINDFAGRPFTSVEEADETMIANWNAVVRPTNTVWVLGDYALGDRTRALGYLSRLNGTVHLITGNHDKPWVGHEDGWRHVAEYMDAGFASVQPFGRLRLPALTKRGPRRRVLLSHFPYDADHTSDIRYAQFRLRDEGMVLLHGHVHDSYTTQRSANGTLCVNVGVDRWDFTPVSLRTVAELVDAEEAHKEAVP